MLRHATALALTNHDKARTRKSPVIGWADCTVAEAFG